MYGLKDPDTGRVGPFNRGAMFGSIEVFLFILSIGGFMSVVFSTGALDRGIHHLSYRFRERGALLIAIPTLLFGALGSIKGWSDESLGFFAMMIPLMNHRGGMTSCSGCAAAGSSSIGNLPAATMSRSRKKLRKVRRNIERAAVRWLAIMERAVQRAEKPYPAEMAKTHSFVVTGLCRRTTFL
jgi:C4-dicarboxylate anaerobic transporter